MMSHNTRNYCKQQYHYIKSIQNLCKFIHFLTLDVALACLCLNDPRELYRRHPQVTTEYCTEMYIQNPVKDLQQNAFEN